MEGSEVEFLCASDVALRTLPVSASAPPHLWHTNGGVIAVLSCGEIVIAIPYISFKLVKSTDRIVFKLSQVVYFTSDSV